MPPLPGNEALLRGYLPPCSLHKALFLGGNVALGGVGVPLDSHEHMPVQQGRVAL